MARRSTRFEHTAELAAEYGYRDFTVAEAELAQWVDDRAWTTGDGPKALFDGAVAWLRERQVVFYQTPQSGTGAPTTPTSSTPGSVSVPGQQDKSITSMPQDPATVNGAGQPRFPVLSLGPSSVLVSASRCLRRSPLVSSYSRSPSSYSLRCLCGPTVVTSPRLEFCPVRALYSCTWVISIAAVPVRCVVLTGPSITALRNGIRGQSSRWGSFFS